MLRLQKYDLAFEFKPDKHLIVADTLSRASMCNNTSTTEIMALII